MKRAVQSIIHKINADAESHGGERYDQIKKEIDAEIERENAYYRDEFEKRRESLINHNEREFARLAERIESRLHHELLAYRNELLDGIFERALDELKNISAEEFAAMFVNAVKDITGSYELYPGELSEGMFDGGFAEDAVKNIAGLTVVRGGGTIPRRSGFVLKNETVEYDFLFEDMIEEKKARQAAAILREVFLD